MTELIQWFQSIDDIRFALYSLNILVILDIVIRQRRKFKEKRFIEYLEDERHKTCNHKFKIADVRDTTIDPICIHCDKTLYDLSPQPETNREILLKDHEIYVS